MGGGATMNFAPGRPSPSRRHCFSRFSTYTHFYMYVACNGLYFSGHLLNERFLIQKVEQRLKTRIAEPIMSMNSDKKGNIIKRKVICVSVTGSVKALR